MLVVIDPGHGGSDPGAIGSTGLKESDVNLAISLLVRGKLTVRGIRCFMTRERDEDVSLEQRVAKANAAKADLFVSIHSNHDGPTANGTEVYYYPGSVKGKRLADCIYRELLRKIGLRGRGVKPASYYVIRETRMPACLVEVAFISNPEEEKLLRDDAFRERAAEGIALGILAYIGQTNQTKPKQVVNVLSSVLLFVTGTTLILLGKWYIPKLIEA